MASDDALLLSELASTMLRDVFRAVNDSAMEQLEAYAELSAKVSVPEETYVAGLLGATPAAQEKTATRYVLEVVLPLLALPADLLPELLLLSEAQRETLLGIFAGVTINLSPAAGDPVLQTIEDLIVESGNKAFPWMIKGQILRIAGREKLAREARMSYTKLRTMLRAGLPNVAVSGGQIYAKVTMSTVDPAAPPSSKAVPSTQTLPSTKTAAPGSPPALVAPGRPSLAVRVANERSAAFSRSQELIGSVKIDFRAGTFPPFDPSK